MIIPSVWVYIPLELNYTKYRLCINKPYGVGYKNTLFLKCWDIHITVGVRWVRCMVGWVDTYPVNRL